MGMYDYIKLKKDYPKFGIKKNTYYQTNDTDSQYLDKYKITKKGTLYHRKEDREWIEDKTEVFGGFVKINSLEWVKDKHTGVINIITDDDSEVVLFLDKGKLFKIVKG